MQSVDELLQRHLGADLAGLQSEWRRFLRGRVGCVPELVERLRAKQLGSEADLPAHCDRCFAHLGDTSTCVACA